jgi:butyryl-CoA dehydrogenase
MGNLCGGWQLARAAVAAQARLGKGGGDTGFLNAKIATARFFADYQLALVPALGDTIVQGAAGVLALAEEQF